MVTTRHGGTSGGPYATLNLGYATADGEEQVTANREIVREALGVGHDDLMVGRLTHGTGVAVFRGQRGRWPAGRTAVRAGSELAHHVFDADAAVSDVPGLHFLLTFADCVPLMFFDRQHRVLGVAHAGWRGTAAGIAQEVVRTMSLEFGSRPEDIAVGVGPSIGPCCYEVGTDVPDTFRRHGQRPVMEGNRLDLWESTALQLAEAGVTAVEVSGICTRCHADDFFSHRGEGGRTGRFGLIAGLGS